MGVKGRGSEARIILAPNLVREYILRIGTYVSGVSARYICNALVAGCCTCAVHGSQHKLPHDLNDAAPVRAPELCMSPFPVEC
jgi:hypothetical protein